MKLPDKRALRTIIVCSILMARLLVSKVSSEVGLETCSLRPQGRIPQDHNENFRYTGACWAMFMTR